MADDKTLDFFSNLISAFIGAGAALFIYYKGVKHEKKKEISRQKDKDEGNINYVKLSIEETQKAINSYVDILKRIRDKITASPLYFPNIDFILFPFAERLSRKSDQNAIFEAINNCYPAEGSYIYSKLFSTVDYIVYALPEIHLNNDNAIKADKERKLRYKEIIDSTMNEIAQLGLTSGDEFGANFKLEVEALLRAFHLNRTSNLDLEYYQQEYVIKFRDFLFDNYKTSAKLLTIATKLKDASQLYGGMQQHNFNHIKVLDVYIEQLGIANETLDNIHKKMF